MDNHHRARDYRNSEHFRTARRFHLRAWTPTHATPGRAKQEKGAGCGRKSLLPFPDTLSVLSVLGGELSFVLAQEPAVPLSGLLA
jgi:hypothetical protein